MIGKYMKNYEDESAMTDKEVQEVCDKRTFGQKFIEYIDNPIFQGMVLLSFIGILSISLVFIWICIIVEIGKIK